jgi:hypothetical protein
MIALSTIYNAHGEDAGLQLWAIEAVVSLQQRVKTQAAQIIFTDAAVGQANRVRVEEWYDVAREQTRRTEV